jgi:thioredoxin 1
MKQQSPRRSLLIVLAVAVVVIGVVVVKSLPKKQAAPARPTPADRPVGDSAAAPEDPIRHDTGEEPPEAQGPEERRTQLASEAGKQEGSPAPVAPDRPPKAEPKEPSSEPEPPVEAEPATAEPAPPKPKEPAAEVPAPAETPAEAEPAAGQPAQPEPKEPVEPLPGSKLKQALSSGQPTMVDFGAGWCQPCKMMDPVLKEAARKYQGKANIVYVDTDEFPQMARDYKIRAIPTQIFFDSSGKEVNRHMGYWPLEELDRQLAALGVGG